MISDREFLRSKGFEVGERGRFSSPMVEALKTRDNKTKTDTMESVIAKASLPTSVIQTKVREPRELFGYTKEGNKVGFITCFKCHTHMMWCKCDLVTAPSIVTRCENPLVKVGG